jgi:hypothetical protein
VLHILPKGLMRIRHYGFLTNRSRKVKLAQIRTSLAHVVQQTPSVETDGKASGAFVNYPCSECHIGRLRIVGLLAPRRFEGG